LKVCILHLRVLLYFGLFLTLLQNSTGSTRWGDISMLGALKFALSEFSWWEQGLQAACFDSLPAANGREKLARGGQWGQPGLLPSQNSPSRHAPEISAVHGFAVGEPSHGQGCAEQSRAEHACKCNKGQGLAPRIVRHRIDCTALQAATRPTIDKKRRNISSCRAMDPENSFTSCGSTADREDPTYLASTRACVCVYSRWQRGKAAISVNS
jgi:hypothetical protein